MIPQLSDYRLSLRARRLALVAWILLVIAGYFALMAILDTERQRDTRQWEVRLSLIAAARSQAVEGWLEDRSTALKNLADNVSLKLYMTEVMSPHINDEFANEPAQVTYLRNLIISSARTGGFSAPPVSPADLINANVKTPAMPGIVLSDPTGASLVTTRSTPTPADLPEALRDFSHPKEPVFSGPFPLGENRYAIAFRKPVYGVQADAATSDPMGFIFGIALLDDGFFNLLKPDAHHLSGEASLLLQRENGIFAYISPPEDGHEPLELKFDKKSSDAGIRAAENPSGLIEARDYRGADVFVVAQPVKETNWFVIHRINRDVALAETAARARWLTISYLLAVLMLSAAFAALWKQAVALRARENAAHYRTLAHRIRRHEELLELIARNSPIGTVIADSGQHYRYANRQAAENVGWVRSEMIGKTLSLVHGQVHGEELSNANRKAMSSHTEQQHIWRSAEDDEIRSVRMTRHIPIDAIPIPEEAADIPGVLMIEQDLTEIVRSEERQRRTLRRLIETLVMIIDRRDPSAARHSACVARIAYVIAKHLRLDPVEIHAAETAGQLMNLGKLLVPVEMLTASGKLRGEDREFIRRSLMTTADMLEGIAFEGPVVETIRQCQERIDGSGPLGLVGEDILITARIVGTANRFAAMARPRSYRKEIGFEKATQTMLEEIGTVHDRRVVTALLHYLENEGGRQEIETLMGQGEG